LAILATGASSKAARARHTICFHSHHASSELAPRSQD
jgi:hypothetical protein